MSEIYGGYAYRKGWVSEPTYNSKFHFVWISQFGFVQRYGTPRKSSCLKPTFQWICIDPWSDLRWCSTWYNISKHEYPISNPNSSWKRTKVGKVTQKNSSGVLKHWLLHKASYTHPSVDGSLSVSVELCASRRSAHLSCQGNHPVPCIYIYIYTYTKVYIYMWHDRHITLDYR